MNRLALTLAAIILITFIANGVDLPQSDSGSKIIQSNEIRDKLSSNTPINYYNKTILGDLDLRRLNETSSPIQIINCTFLGNIKFDSLAFAEPIDFRRSIFINECSFKGAKFYKDVTFEDVQFTGDAIFANSEFRKLSDFAGCIFCEEANFGKCKFNSSSFKRAKFLNSATFSLAEFSADSKMDEINFTKNAYFIGSQFRSDADFKNSEFNERADFHNVDFIGDAVFTSARFNGTAIFHEARFDEDANFDDAMFFVVANFKRAYFRKDAFFWGASFAENSLSLDGAKFTRFITRWDDLQDCLLYNEIIYSALIKNFKDLGRVGDANDCYYEYMNNRQKDGFWDFLASALSYFSCGYGVRLGRTILICASLIILFGFVYRNRKGIEKLETNSVDISPSIIYHIWDRMRRSYALQCLHFSAKVFVGGKSEKISLVNGCEYLATLERILGWFFFALVVGVLTRTMIG